MKRDALCCCCKRVFCCRYKQLSLPFSEEMLNPNDVRLPISLGKCVQGKELPRETHITVTSVYTNKGLTFLELVLDSKK